MLKIDRLLEKRKRLRRQRKYAQADQLRKQLEERGYSVVDEKEKSFLIPKTASGRQKPGNSFLVFFGSGEISAAGRRIHELIFEKINRGPISIAIINTPAGFQPNVKTVYGEIADFFREKLKNFHPQISIVTAENRSRANNEKIIAPVDQADYIFTGPGSPTYAVKNLKGTRLLEKIAKRVKNGASLSLASAAVLAFSHYCLPVYEIYKVGEKLHWKEGVDFLKSFWQPMTFMPHFDNNDGGEKNDTAYCFMGAKRFKKLLALLPRTERVIGIDEQTAAVFDLQRKELTSYGRGTIHSIR